MKSEVTARMTPRNDAVRFTLYVLRDLPVLLILALITLAFFWPMILTGQWIPHGGGDLVSFLWPQYSFAAQSIHNGSIPLWNPHLFSGAPSLADNQSGMLYPINLLAFVLFPNFSYQVMEGLVVFHIWLAGVAMYFALRLWPLTPQNSGGAQAAPGPSPDAEKPVAGRGEMVRVPAVFGAVAYMLSDVFVTHIGNLNLIAVAAWMPLVFGLFARGLRDRRTGLTLGAGVVFANALLAGHAQMTAITFIGLIAIAVWQIIVASNWRDRIKVMGLAAAALIVTFGLTAIQLLPSLEMTRYSLRSGLSYEEATAYSLPPVALASIFSPLLFGRGAVGFWGTWQRVESGYLGVVPLLLIGFAFTRRRSNGAWFLAVLGVLGVLIALGKYAPIYSLVHALPVLGGLRVPARFILLTDFALATLAALGLQQLGIESKVKWRWTGLIVVSGLVSLWLAFQSALNSEHTGNLVAAAISFGLFSVTGITLVWLRSKSAISRQRTSILFLGLLVADLVALGSTVEIDANDPTLGYQQAAIVAFLRGDQNVFRVENTANAWQPDAALIHGLNDIGGIFNPLGLANYETYRGGMGNRGSPLYNFLGAKYVLANKNEPPGDAPFVPVFSADPQIDVYLNTNALPRAQLIDQARIVQSGEEAWQAIHAPDFDPSTTVVVEGGAELSDGDQIAQRALSFVSASDDRVELIAQTSSPAYLVLSDVYYPGWTATIDDRPTDINPADFAFRAVFVPSGWHRVVFQFEPLSWKIGSLISGVTMVALIVLGLMRWRR